METRDIAGEGRQEDRPCSSEAVRLAAPLRSHYLGRMLQGMASNRYAILVTLLAFGVYLRTLAPTIMWYDMGEFALGSYTLGIGHNTGYPLYMMLGKLFTFLPLGDIAYRVNLMSAVFASISVLFIFLIVRHLTRREFPALIAGATVAFSSTFWSNALWAEAHSLNAFFMVAIIYLLLKWREKGHRGYLYVAFLAFGLGLGNHRLILGLFPGMVLFVLLAGEGTLLSLRWRPLLMIGLVVVVGFSVHAYLPLRTMQDPLLKAGDAADIRGFIDMVFLGNSQPGSYDFSLEGMWGRRSVLWAFPRYDFTIPGLLLALGGVGWLLRRDRQFLALTVTPALLTAFVVLTFLLHDVYDYFIPIYLMLGIWLGVGVHQLILGMGRMVGTRSKILRPQVMTYALYALFLSLPLVLFSSNFHLLDRSEDYEAFDFASNVMSNLPQDSVIVADWWTYYPLFYQQVVNDLRPDVYLTNILSAPGEDPGHFIEARLKEGRRVYVAEGLKTKTLELSREYTLVPVASHAITSPVTNYLPRPEYKDHLVVKRDVYEVVREEPSLVVSRVTEPLEEAVTFGEKISLRSLVLSAAEVARGGSFSIEYTWELNLNVEENLYARVLFVDEQGQIQLKQGFPLWFQASEIGAGIYPTSEWKPGQKVGYAYQTLVPRQVKPGTYYLELRVYDSKATARELLPSTDSGSGGVVVGQIRVVDLEEAQAP